MATEFHCFHGGIIKSKTCGRACWEAVGRETSGGRSLSRKGGFERLEGCILDEERDDDADANDDDEESEEQEVVVDVVRVGWRLESEVAGERDG